MPTIIENLVPCLCNYVSEGSTLEEFHNDPEFITHEVTVEHVDDVRMVVIPHYDNLQNNYSSFTVFKLVMNNYKK